MALARWPPVKGQEGERLNGMVIFDTNNYSEKTCTKLSEWSGMVGMVFPSIRINQTKKCLVFLIALRSIPEHTGAFRKNDASPYD